MILLASNTDNGGNIIMWTLIGIIILYSAYKKFMDDKNK